MPATLRVPVAGWPKKLELGPLSSGQGKLMQFVDPDRIEQSDRVQAASFAHIGYHLPRRHCSSRGIKRKKQNLHSFIVASLNAQSVKGNDMACKRCEISTFIKDNGVDLFFVTETWLSAQGDEAKTVELAPSGFDVKLFPRQSRSRGG